MTSRQTGRRIQAMTRQRRSAGRRRNSEPLSPRDLRLLVRLVACGSIFVVLVAAKLLLPGKMAAFNETLRSVMEQNLDVQAVFSAVGKGFAGIDGAGELYQAVFHPQRTEAAARKVTLQDGAALDILRSYRIAGKPEEEPPAKDPADPVASAPAGGDAAEASNLAYILYSQENMPEGVSMEQAILGFDYCTPVSGTLSSGFGYREHPVEGEERFHYGVDLAAETGTEVDCFADGTVTAVGESSSYGRYCMVAHEGGYTTLYAHCSRVTASSGAAVRRGEKIAEVGETGMATGPHLHFELQRDGAYLNPIYYVSPL